MGWKMGWRFLEFTGGISDRRQGGMHCSLTARIDQVDQENGSFWRRGRPGGTSGAIRGAPDVDGTHAGSGAGGGRRETTPPRAAPHGSSFFAAPYLLATA